MSECVCVCAYLYIKRIRKKHAETQWQKKQVRLFREGCGCWLKLMLNNIAKADFRARDFGPKGFSVVGRTEWSSFIKLISLMDIKRQCNITLKPAIITSEDVTTCLHGDVKYNICCVCGYVWVSWFYIETHINPNMHRHAKVVHRMTYEKLMRPCINSHGSFRWFSARL